jgi:DNA polymerase-3 subunit gamma/tau
MSQALYRKWRPQTFDQVVGQEHITSTLRNAIAAGRISHAYLFTGPRGTGKTTTARLLAKAVNCLDPDLTQRPCNKCATCVAITQGRLLDLVELDAASNRGIDEIRDLRDKIHFSPGEGKYKVYIIDEVHMLTEPAFNALLKTLEEPPPHAIFVLATTDPQKVPATIVSRCQRFDFRRLTLSEITTRLQEIVADEGLSAEPDALTLIARQATGAMRDAESLLDQLAASGGAITLAHAQSTLGAGPVESIAAVADGLAEGSPARGLDAINRALDRGADARQLARQITDYLRQLMLMQVAGDKLLDVPAEQRPAMESQAARLETSQLVRAVKLFNQAASDLRSSWQPQLPLELAYIEAVLGEKQASSVPANPAVTPGRIERPNPPASAPHEASPAPTEPRATASAPPHAAAKSVRATSPAAPLAPIKLTESHPATAVEAPPKPGAAISLEAVQQQWDHILAVLKIHGGMPIKALLSSCKLVSVEGDTLVLSWPSDILRGKFEDSKTKRLVEDVISEAIGSRVMTRCVVSAKAKPTDDPLVQEVIKLGGRVVNA